jgi:competence protein ComEC
LADVRLVSFAPSVEAFAEDCARAAVVISPREAPGDCAATLVDRRIWRGNGAVSLRWTGDGFAMNAARPPGYERPWARGAPVSLQPALRPAAPDATPRTGDLEPGD